MQFSGIRKLGVLGVLLATILMNQNLLSQTPAKSNRQRFTQPDSGIVSSIAALPIAVKDSLVAQGLLTKIIGGYQVKTIYYRAFKKNAEISVVDDTTLYWTGGFDLIGYNPRNGQEVTPDTTVYDTWSIVGYSFTKTARTTIKGGFPTIPHKGSQLEMVRRNKELEKVRKLKHKEISVDEEPMGKRVRL